MNTATGRRGRYPFVWRPEPSKGPHVGIAVGAAGALCAVFLVSALGDVELWPAGLALGAVAGCAQAIAVVGLFGAWRVSSLRYVLSPGALEIRSGAYLRVRYGQIGRIAAGPPPDAGPAPALWPGAYFGYQLVERRPRRVWRATSRDPDRLVAVDTGRVCYVLSPGDADAFRRAVIERADAAAPEAPTAPRTGVEWLDRVAHLDGWIRTMLVGSVLLATALLRIDLWQSGALRSDTLAALGILGLNAVLGLGLSGRALGVARLLIAAAVALEVVAILW